MIEPKLYIEELLKITREKGSSDLHLLADMRPMARTSGRLAPISETTLSGEDIRDVLCSVLTEEQKRILDKQLSVDLAITVEQVGRFRVHGYFQRGNITVVFRRLSDGIPDFESLGLPEIVKEVCDIRDGLVLVTGATGSGKSTTLASIIDVINTKYNKNIITIEDPIEYVHTNKNSLINQRELHTDVLSFPDALRAALRADPDVILVGEMRDLDTMRIAIMAAETGHLVLATLHSRDSVSSINRIIGSFNSEEQQQIRQQLSESLKYVVSQQLLTNKQGDGVVLATEVMKVTPAISNLIRLSKQEHIYMSIETGTQLGMHTMEQSLIELVNKDSIELNVAINSSRNPSIIQQRLRNKIEGV